MELTTLSDVITQDNVEAALQAYHALVHTGAWGRCQACADIAHFEGFKLGLQKKSQPQTLAEAYARLADESEEF